jgi:UDPglucose--hexose-1-phosphate uridylyltransferase
MSELRKDPVSGRWVIIATERSKRPDDFRPQGPVAPASQAAFCPFCEGNEGKTPPEVYAMRAAGTGPDSPGWTVRVVPNKFPALTPGPPPPRATAGLYQSMEGRGVHEVVIENPDHAFELGDLPVPHVRAVLGVFQQRIRTIERDLHYQYVQVFKNKGKEAGASLSHPHSQIVATPIIPRRVKEELYGGDRLFRTFKECGFCRVIREEETAGKRLVARNDRFVAFAPYASRFPFEMAIYPRRHSAFFTDVREEEITPLAEILKDVLTRLKETVGDPPFNMVLRQAPNPALPLKRWPDIHLKSHWHLEIIPILTKVAGFEWGTGLYINPVPPETGARFLRGEA